MSLYLAAPAGGPGSELDNYESYGQFSTKLVELKDRIRSLLRAD